MATGKRFYWLKLKESFLTSDTVDYFMSQPDGANYVVLYQMLCLKTINTNGRLERHIGEMIIPYDVEKIQRDCKWFGLDTIRAALNLYKAFGLVYEDANGTLVMSNLTELVGSETDYAVQKRVQREEQQALPSASVDNVHSNVHIDIRDKILDIDKEKCISKDIHKEKVKNDVPFEEIIDQFNEICTDLPKVITISDARKQLIKARYEKYGMELLITVFKKAHASDFLSGRLKESGHFKASFDWLMKPSNFAKVLDGNYDNRTNQKEQNKPGFDLDEFFENATKKRG